MTVFKVHTAKNCSLHDISIVGAIITAAPVIIAPTIVRTRSIVLDRSISEIRNFVTPKYLYLGFALSFHRLITHPILQGVSQVIVERLEIIAHPVII